jgi:hypothetical protein
MQAQLQQVGIEAGRRILDVRLRDLDELPTT